MKNLLPMLKEPSKAFLQFAERHLSLNKADPSNNPGMKSCLLRVPHTFNSKCIAEGKGDSEVKIIQKWDSTQQLPDIDNLLIETQTFLIDRKLKAEINQGKKRNNGRTYQTNFLPTTGFNISDIPQNALKDYRKSTISLILAPYFVNVQSYLMHSLIE